MQRILGLSGGPSIAGSLASFSREASSFCGPQRPCCDSTGLVQEEEKPGEGEASSLMDPDGLWEAHCYCRGPRGGQVMAQGWRSRRTRWAGMGQKPGCPGADGTSEGSWRANLIGGLLGLEASPWLSW